MPKPDVSTLRPPAYVEESRTFTDTANIGVEIPLTLRVRKDLSQDFAVQETVRTLMTDYVKGRDGGPPGIFKVGPDRVKITPRLCSVAALLSCSEVPEDGDTAYKPEDWFALSVTMPTMTEEVIEWYGELELRAKEQSKNA